MIMKKNIKRDAESQIVEDALCLGESPCFPMHR